MKTANYLGYSLMAYYAAG